MTSSIDPIEVVAMVADVADKANSLIFNITHPKSANASQLQCLLNDTNKRIGSLFTKLKQNNDTKEFCKTLPHSQPDLGNMLEQMTRIYHQEVVPKFSHFKIPGEGALSDWEILRAEVVLINGGYDCLLELNMMMSALETYLLRIMPANSSEQPQINQHSTADVADGVSSSEVEAGGPHAELLHTASLLALKNMEFISLRSQNEGFMKIVRELKRWETSHQKGRKVPEIAPSTSYDLPKDVCEIVLKVFIEILGIQESYLMRNFHSTIGDKDAAADMGMYLHSKTVEFLTEPKVLPFVANYWNEDRIGKKTLPVCDEPISEQHMARLATLTNSLEQFSKNPDTLLPVEMGDNDRKPNGISDSDPIENFNEISKFCMVVEARDREARKLFPLPARLAVQVQNRIDQIEVILRPPQI